MVDSLPLLEQQAEQLQGRLKPGETYHSLDHDPTAPLESTGAHFSTLDLIRRMKGHP